MKTKSTIRHLACACLLAFGSLATSILAPSCGTAGTGASLNLPFDLGVRYQLEPGIFIAAKPGADGALDFSLEGEGQLSENIRKEGNAFIITSPKSGIIYRVTQDPGKKPLIEILSGGDGKLQLIPSPA